MRDSLSVRAVLMALTMLSALVTAPAVAAVPVEKSGLRLLVILGARDVGPPFCFIGGEGARGPDTTVTLIRDGLEIRKQTTPTFVENGFFAAEWDCGSGDEGRARIGDLVVAESGGEIHRLKVPDIRAEIDVRSDRASGRVPPGSLEVVVADCVVGRDCSGDTLFLHPETRRNGRWSIDVRGQFDIQGGDAVGVSWTSPEGDSVNALSGAPHITAQNGSPVVSGHANPGERVRVALFGPDGSFKALGSQRVTNDEGTFSITMRRGGSSVPVEIGDVLRSNVFPGAAIETIDGRLAVDAESSLINAVCFPKSEWQIQVTTPNSIYGHSGVADQSGLVQEDRSVSQDEIPMRADDEVKLWCTNPQGNSQLFVANPL